MDQNVPDATFFQFLLQSLARFISDPISCVVRSRSTMAEAEPTHADDTGGRRDRSRSRERNDAGAPVEGAGASNGGRADDPAGYSHAPPPQYGGGGGQH